jgi:hypothetical protein
MGERIGKVNESIKQNARKAGALVAIGGTALFATGCGSTETHTLPEARQIANKKYERVYDNTSPAGKFVVQYLRRSYADVVATRDSDNNYDVSSFYKFQFNDGCLGGSAYDIAGGDFHINVTASGSGLFSSSSADANVNGRFPAAAANAYVSDKHPDLLRIESGHTNTQPLVFHGVQGGETLEPVSQHTKNVLSTYGCEEGPAGYAVEHGDFLQPPRELFLK